MFGCECIFWNRVTDTADSVPESFSLPAPIPRWSQGSGFSTKIIKLGELEAYQVTEFELIWSSNVSTRKKHGVGFYKPSGIPQGFYCLGHYCQSNGKALRGFVVVAREAATIKKDDHNHKPSLSNPVDYALVWSSDDVADENFIGGGYFWLPQPPEGYKALGFVVTTSSEKPDLKQVKCVRADLTDTCQGYSLITKMYSKPSNFRLMVFSTRPYCRGMYERGVHVGSFYCSSSEPKNGLEVGCLKNMDENLAAMPNEDQIHELVRHYGPTLFLHPDEVYLPSSVSWFFGNGALLCSKENSKGQVIQADGSNLPTGGANDGSYWISLPSDDEKGNIKHGNLESTKLYLHIKPALGGTFTDIVFWIFCPFNGPGTLMVGMVNLALGKVGQHVGDWEHFTLRISNFTGELWKMYFSQHSGGKWIDAYDLEFVHGSNKPIVYSSRNGHASFPHPGNYLQGLEKLGIGVRNDAARSDRYVDSSIQYEIVAAEYLRGVVKEPCWLQYMRKWGPTVVYNSRAELEKIIEILPPMIKNSLEGVLNKLPLELYGEDGPTGPKEKNNWMGDERW